MFSFIKGLNTRSRTLLITCFFGFFCNGTLSLMMGSILPDMKATYGLSDTVSGLLISAHSIGNLVAGFISGLLPLVFGKRKSILLTTCLAMIGFVMMAVFGNPVWLFLAFVFSGFGRGGISNFNNAEVNRLSGGNPAATNLLHACFAVGAITAPMVCLLLSGMMNWRAAAVYVSVLEAAAVFLFSRMQVENDKPDRQAKENRTLAFVREPRFFVLALTMFFYICSEYAVNGWLVTYIQSRQELMSGFNATGEALTAAVRSYSQSMATLMWAMMLVGRLLCAGLSARVSQKILIMVSSFGVVAFFALMLFSGSIVAVTAAVAGLGLSMAGISPMIYSDAADYTNTYPMATSVILATGGAGGLLMPTVVGAIADVRGFTGGMSAILVSVVLLAIFASLNVKLSYKKRDKAGRL